MARAKCEACKRRAVKGPRARFCDNAECVRARARDRRRKADQLAKATAAATEPPAEEPRGVGSVFAATLIALTEAGRVHTPAAQNALALASWMDAAGEDTGGGKAALSKQHLAALEDALKDAGATEDPVDEITARRRKRLRGA